MKLLIYTDVHGSPSSLKKIAELAKKHKPEIAVCAGDMSIFGQNLEEILHKMNSIGVPTLLIHGNHESAEDVKMLCVGLKNLMFIHKKAVLIKDVLFVGYGGGGFSLLDPNFRIFGQNVKKRIGKAKAVVLVTHAPPYDTLIDYIGEEPCGNKDIKHFIMEVKPDLAISGHLHENNGKSEKLGKTLIINPGPNGKIVNV
jgi:hypothetical protein